MMQIISNIARALYLGTSKSKRINEKPENIRTPDFCTWLFCTN